MSELDLDEIEKLCEAPEGLGYFTANTVRPLVARVRGLEAEVERLREQVELLTGEGHSVIQRAVGLALAPLKAENERLRREIEELKVYD